MPMVGASMAATMQLSLASKGNIGVNLLTFCTAIGVGSVMSLVGKTFTTSDTGVGSGAGAGIGIGITGVTGSSVSKLIQAAYLSEFGSMGTLLPDITDAIGLALELELAKATLISAHAPVYVGSGIVDLGSIKVSPSQWASNIQQAGPTLLGSDWPRFAKIVGQGCSEAFKTASGVVVITGGGPPPPTSFSGLPNTVTPAGVIS